MKQAATCLPAPIVAQLQILHRHTAGARHGTALTCPVGEGFLVELQQAVQHFRNFIEQRPVALEQALSVALARIEVLEQARCAAELEPDSYDIWFEGGEDCKVQDPPLEVHSGSTRTQENAQSLLQVNDVILCGPGPQGRIKGSMKTQEHAKSQLQVVGPQTPPAPGRKGSMETQEHAKSLSQGVEPQTPPCSGTGNTEQGAALLCPMLLAISERPMAEAAANSSSQVGAGQMGCGPAQLASSHQHDKSRLQVDRSPTPQSLLQMRGSMETQEHAQSLSQIEGSDHDHIKSLLQVNASMETQEHAQSLLQVAESQSLWKVDRSQTPQLPLHPDDHAVVGASDDSDSHELARDRRLDEIAYHLAAEYAKERMLMAMLKAWRQTVAVSKSRKHG